jgi:ribosomal protein S18 acetylase RimI-like enzyme
VRLPSGPTVDRAQPADASEVEALLDAAAAWHQSRGIGLWTPGRFGDEVRQTIATGELFVARRDGVLVGCFLLDMDESPVFSRWLEEEGRVAAPGAYLGRLAVAREAAGRGLGLELLDAACALAAALGLEYVRLECPAENHRLRRYYLDAGFAHCGDVHVRGPNGENWVASLFERPVT